MARHPEEFNNFPEALRCDYGPFAGIIRHIVDGDTVDLLISPGFNQYAYIVGRLAGIDCPETNRAESKEAGLAAKARTAELLPIGSPVRVWTRPDPDSFGRYIVDLQTERDGDVGGTLLVEGFAVPYTRGGKP